MADRDNQGATGLQGSRSATATPTATAAATACTRGVGTCGALGVRGADASDSADANKACSHGACERAGGFLQPRGGGVNKTSVHASTQHKFD